MSQHALLSPSSAHRWLACPASVAASAGLQDKPSEHAAEGTLAHDLAACALETGTDAPDTHPELQVYLDYVRAIPGERMVEQRIDIAAVTGEAGAQGTADAVVIDGDTLHVIDLKWGRGVQVDAENNEQLILYALGALDSLDPLGEIETVALAIVQPRIGHLSKWVTTAEHLRGLQHRIRLAAGHALALTVKGPEPADYRPGEKQCRWCLAKATCPAATAHVLDTVAGDFTDVSQDLAPQLEPGVIAVDRLGPDDLGRCMAALPLVETWVKAVRGETETRLLAGLPVPGFKLVAGRKGARRWADEGEAEAALKAMRLKQEQMYDLKLISPTTAEKLHSAGAIGPRQWPKLQGLITQADGAPSVAPDADKRPALAVSATADEFQDETEGGLT